MPLLKRQQDNALSVASTGSLLVAVFYGSPMVRHLDEMKAIEDELIAQHGKFSLLVVGLDVLDGIRISDEVRKRSTEIAKALDSKTLGTAFALLQPGLTGIMLRTFLAGLSLIARTKSPQKTFGSVAEGVDWLQALPGQNLAVAREKHLAVQIGAFLADVATNKVA